MDALWSVAATILLPDETDRCRSTSYSFFTAPSTCTILVWRLPPLLNLNTDSGGVEAKAWGTLAGALQPSSTISQGNGFLSRRSRNNHQGESKDSNDGEGDQ